MYPEPVNITGFIEMVNYANIVTDNTFVIMLLISVYLIPLIYLLVSGRGIWESALAAGFIVTVVSIFLRVTEILTVNSYIYLCVISIVIPFVFSMLKET